MRIGLLLGCALAAALALAVPASGSHPAGAPAAPTGVLPPLPPSPAPSITGTARAGSTLTGHDGGWEAGATLSRQWLRCDAAGAGCVFLHDTDLTHTLADADVGKRIRLRVRATTVSGTREVDSAPTAPVAGQKPSSLASPTVEGKLREGEIILSAPGVWLGTEPLAFSNRWERCDPKRCVATGDRLFLHKLVNADVGKRMRGTVTVSNAWGSTTEHTPQSAIVKPRLVPPERLKPFPRIEIKGVIRPNGVELLRLAVRAPRRSTLRVGCRGGGCPYRRVRGRMRTTLFLVRRLLHRTLAVGTVIEMRVTARNKIGKYTRFRIVRNRPPARVDRCLVPGEPGPSRCSSRR